MLSEARAGDACVENLRTLVDHRIEAALENLIVCDRLAPVRRRLDGSGSAAGSGYDEDMPPIATNQPTGRVKISGAGAVALL